MPGAAPAGCVPWLSAWSSATVAPASPASRAGHQPGQPHPRVRRQPALTRAGLVFLAGRADSDGKLEVGPDLDRPCRRRQRPGPHQRLCHQREPGGIPPDPGTLAAGNVLARRSSASASCRRWVSARSRFMSQVSPRKHAAAAWPLAFNAGGLRDSAGCAGNVVLRPGSPGGLAVRGGRRQ